MGSWIFVWTWSLLRVIIVAAMASVERRPILRAEGNSMLAEVNDNVVREVFGDFHRRLGPWIRFQYSKAKI